MTAGTEPGRYFPLFPAAARERECPRIMVRRDDDQGAGVFGGPVKHGSRSPVKIKEFFHHFFQVAAVGCLVDVGPFNHQEKSVGIPGKGVQGFQCGLAENVSPLGGRGKIPRSGDGQRFSGRQGAGFFPSAGDAVSLRLHFLEDIPAVRPLREVFAAAAKDEIGTGTGVIPNDAVGIRSFFIIGAERCRGGVIQLAGGDNAGGFAHVRRLVHQGIQPVALGAYGDSMIKRLGSRRHGGARSGGVRDQLVRAPCFGNARNRAVFNKQAASVGCPCGGKVVDAHAVSNHQDYVGDGKAAVRFRDFRHRIGAFQNEALVFRRRKQGRSKKEGKC